MLCKKTCDGSERQLLLRKTSKAPDLFIENKLCKSPKKLAKWGDHVHYLKVKKCVLVIWKVGECVFAQRGMPWWQVG